LWTGLPAALPACSAKSAVFQVDFGEMGGGKFNGVFTFDSSETGGRIGATELSHGRSSGRLPMRATISGDSSPLFSALFVRLHRPAGWLQRRYPSSHHPLSILRGLATEC
jgi:hypothetical protein